MVPFFILFGSQHFVAKFDYFMSSLKIIQNGSIFHSFWFSTFCCKIWLKKVNLKNHSKWFHFSFILVLNILLQNSAKKVNLKNHSKWFHFSFILVLNILLQNLANKSQLKKSFKMVPFFIHFGSQHFFCKIWLKKVNLKNHSKWFHFSFILVLNILLQNLAKKSQLKKSFKMVPFFIHFGSQHFVAKFG